MKTITIPDEMYNELKKLAIKYATQDNCHQANPVMFAIQGKQKIYCGEDYGDEYEYTDSTSGDYASYTAKDAQEWCKDNNFYFDESKDTLGDEETQLQKHYYRNEYTFDISGMPNIFFTKEGALNYIKQDAHNINLESPRPYGITPYKNYEMELLSKFLYAIAKESE